MGATVTKTLLSIPDFLATTGLGRTKAYALIADGELETVRVGRRRLIPAQALDAWIERLRGGAAA